MEDGNRGNGDNGNEESSQNEREGRETGEEEKMEGEGEAGGARKEGETEEKDGGVAEDTVKDLFRLSAVNAYGSQEVRKIEDEPSKVYTITSEFHCTSILLYYPNL